MTDNLKLKFKLIKFYCPTCGETIAVSTSYAKSDTGIVYFYNIPKCSEEHQEINMIRKKE